MLLGVTFSPREDLRRWRAEVGLRSRLLSDVDRRVAIAYGAARSPDQEKAGRVSVLVGPDGRVVRVYEPADVVAHPGEVLADLDGG